MHRITDQSSVIAAYFSPAKEATMATIYPAGSSDPQSSPPSYRLFDSGAVLVAATFGGPLAGSLLMAVNYKRLDRSGQGVLVVFLGAILTAVLVAIGWNMTQVSSGLAVLALIATWRLAKAVQGRDVAAHVARGGQLGSKGAAFGIGVLTLAGVFGATAFVVYETQNRNFVTVGTKDQVFYLGAATKADAAALGNALKGDSYFQNRGVTVLLEKGNGGTTISFVVQNGAWNQPGVLSSFEQIAWQAAAAVGGYPVQVHLVNRDREVEKTSTVGEAAFDGGDAVFYEGNGTQAQAQALGQQLKALGFFRGNGANVFVTEHDDGTTLTFVVAETAWDDPDAVKDFEEIAREVAPAIGGLPLHMQLDDSTLTVKKDELLK